MNDFREELSMVSFSAAFLLPMNTDSKDNGIKFALKCIHTYISFIVGIFNYINHCYCLHIDIGGWNRKVAKKYWLRQ